MNLTIKRLLSKRLSASYLFEKSFDILKNNFNKVYDNLFDTEISDNLFERIISRDYNNGLKDYLQNKLNNPPCFFLNFPENSTDISPIAKENIVNSANKVCSHFFNLLGSGEINLGRDINWHKDFKSGYIWDEKKYYKDIEIPVGKADIKVPWELSRFQHLSIIGRAYQLTKDEKYSKEFVNEVTSWIENNKPRFGVNWKCTMDVAIRACNLILGFYYFKESPEIDGLFLMRFLKSLYQHGRHIIANLENKGNLKTNHYLSNLTGLIYIGSFFPELVRAKRWKNFAVRQLKKEMDAQIYEEGTNFEASTCYHRLVLELFFFSTLLVVINDKGFKGNNFEAITKEIFGESYSQRLYKMFDAVLHLLKPNGRMPQIGDNDNGRLHVFSENEILDMGYLLSFGAVFFNEAKFKIREFGFCDDIIWVFGKKGIEIWDNLKENSLLNIESKAYPQAGWYVMRHYNNYCIISCGSNGQNGNGGHAHNDKLSFELFVNGKDIIVDPGTYLYTYNPHLRNVLRGVGSHNTVIIDGNEQNKFDEGELFRLPDNARAKCLKWNIGRDVDEFLGEHYGYSPKIHKREIKFYKKDGRLEIIDYLTAVFGDDCEWVFIFSPSFLSFSNIKSEKIIFTQTEAHYSPEYGVLEKTACLKGKLKGSLEDRVKIVIEPS